MKKNSATIHMVNKEEQCSYGICCSIAMRISIYKNVYIYIDIYVYILIHPLGADCSSYRTLFSKRISTTDWEQKARQHDRSQYCKPYADWEKGQSTRRASSILYINI